MDITVDAVLAMAPDEASVRAARSLASPGKWQTLGFDDAAVWGLCQGSGSKPYQTKVDLSGPVCSCSCPSRKIPCKHALALLLLLAGQKGAFAGGDRPEWVSEWLEGRRQRAAKKEENRTRKKGSASASPQKEAARLGRMSTGIDELCRWMNDQVVQGFSSLSGHYEDWDRVAARMVDAQMPALAARLRSMGSLVDGGEDWPAVLLGRMGMIQLLADAFSRMASLSPGQQADVRSALGYLPDKDAVLAGEDRVSDVWAVVGVSVAEEDRLWRRRVWLFGRESGRMALLLDFSHGTRSFEPVFLPGGSARMTLSFYPGDSPLRAVVADVPVPEPFGPLPSFSLEEALHDLARRLAGSPWQTPLPLFFGGARLVRGGERWQLLSEGGGIVPLAVDDDAGWKMLAAGGGHPFIICGEWDGSELFPVGFFPQTPS
ncbi:SWIM zinc finger family protein [uncultured Mailhella sp.]|uniref:SWIM zinc finger family protein n=1 Tax=uncultured Mailhella sp. TaxID=1981031 RepID=UPI0025FC025A|nr:SWIM zinc finger family protein [uncultured Mailhella sp.]